MKLVSYRYRGRESYGAVAGDGIVDLGARLRTWPTLLSALRADALGELRRSAEGVRPDVPLADVELLPPVVGPEKTYCIGINYANRSKDYGDAEPRQFPSMFYRAPNSLVGHGQPLLRPPESPELDYEGEFALVIGKTGRRIAKERALEHVAGITLCNEGTIRDWMRHGRFNVTQGKNWDGLGSIGPWLMTADEIDLTKPLEIVVKLNGTVTQRDTTANMIHSFADIIVYVSTFATLKPGDVLVTGTPVKLEKTEPPVWLKPGDVVEISSPQIGTLRNTVADETVR